VRCARLHRQAILVELRQTCLKSCSNVDVAVNVCDEISQDVSAWRQSCGRLELLELRELPELRKRRELRDVNYVWIRELRKVRLGGCPAWEKGAELNQWCTKSPD
jgi:hypothetical protein